MSDCTCKITPGTSAYGGSQIDSRGCEKHDTRDELLEALRARIAELEGEATEARAGEARALEAVEVAKAALQAEAFRIASGTPTMDGKHFYRILSGDQHAVATAYKTALARLEGR